MKIKFAEIPRSWIWQLSSNTLRNWTKVTN